MNETKEKIKYPGILNKLWHDPIWGKLIYTGILFILGLLYSFFTTIFKEISFVNAFVETLNICIPIYLIFIIIALAFIIYEILNKIRQKRNKHIGIFDVEQEVGNFKFRELYNALLTHNLDVPPDLLRHVQGNKINLLSLFILYQRQFNLGVEWDEDGYLYYTLGSILMSYGLTEKIPTKSKLDKIGSETIQTSKVGTQFLALLEKYRVYNDKKMTEDITKTGEPKKPKKE